MLAGESQTQKEPSVPEIVAFVRKRTRLMIESDKAFVTADPELLLFSLYESCLGLGLCQRTKVYQRMQLSAGRPQGEPLSFLSKFLVVQEVFASLLRSPSVSLLDFIQPSVIRVRALFGVVMRYTARFEGMLGRFELKFAGLKALQEELAQRSAALAALEAKFAKLEDSLAAERPRSEQLGAECRSVACEIQMWQLRLEDESNRLQDLEALLAVTEERAESRSKTLGELREQTTSLSGKLVPDSKALRKRFEESRSLVEAREQELSQAKARTEQLEERGRAFEGVFTRLEAGLRSMEALSRKQKQLRAATQAAQEAEQRLLRARAGLGQQDEHITQLRAIEASEARNLQQFRADAESKLEQNQQNIRELEARLEAITGAKEESTRLLREAQERAEQLEATRERLRADQRASFSALEHLYAHASQRLAGYKTCILQMGEQASRPGSSGRSAL